jgi:hypothetical protein
MSRDAATRECGSSPLDGCAIRVERQRLPERPALPRRGRWLRISVHTNDWLLDHVDAFADRVCATHEPVVT